MKEVTFKDDRSKLVKNVDEFKRKEFDSFFDGDTEIVSGAWLYDVHDFLLVSREKDTESNHIITKVYNNIERLKRLDELEVREKCFFYNDVPAYIERIK